MVLAVVGEKAIVSIAGLGSPFGVWFEAGNSPRLRKHSLDGLTIEAAESKECARESTCGGR